MSIFWESVEYNKARKVLVIPNITNSSNIEKDSFVDVIYNHIKSLESHGEIFWNIILPQPVKKLNLINVKQHILQFSGDMMPFFVVVVTPQGFKAHFVGDSEKTFRFSDLERDLGLSFACTFEFFFFFSSRVIQSCSRHVMSCHGMSCGVCLDA